MILKTIEYPILIEELAADHNSHHLNQAPDSPFTVETLPPILETNSDVPFIEALLNGEENFQQLFLTKVTKRYL